MRSLANERIWSAGALACCGWFPITRDYGDGGNLVRFVWHPRQRRVSPDHIAFLGSRSGT